jgi:hypothetical protein
MLIKYVGLKESETAFSAETGITWEQGSQHEIASLALCTRMLNHPDVFEQVEVAPEPIPPIPVSSGLSDAITLPPAVVTLPPEDDGQQLQTQEQQLPEDDKPAALVMMTKAGPLDLSGMDKADLHRLAKDEGMDIHPNAKAETVARRLVEMFPVPTPESVS